MAATVAIKEPLEFRAGDSVLWVKSLSDYPATGYSLTYYIVGPTKPEPIVATQNGSDFSITLSTAYTTALQAGDYWIEGKVTGADGTFTIYAAAIRVLPNFSTIEAGHDGRTHARKMLDALESAQLADGGTRIVSYTIFGERSVTNMTGEEWLKQHVYWKNLVLSEERQATIDLGNEGAGKVYIRRRNPR